MLQPRRQGFIKPAGRSCTHAERDHVSVRVREGTGLAIEERRWIRPGRHGFRFELPAMRLEAFRGVERVGEIREAVRWRRAYEQRPVVACAQPCARNRLA